MSTLPNQTTTWAGISNKVQEFHEWEKTYPFNCADEHTKLACYLIDQIKAESRNLMDFNHPVLGLISFMNEQNNRLQELLLAYLTLTVTGDNSHALALIKGERLHINLNTSYVNATKCYGYPNSSRDEFERFASTNRLLQEYDFTRNPYAEDEYDASPLQGAWEAWKETHKHPVVPRTILADLCSQDHDTKINAERTLLALLANQEAP